MDHFALPSDSLCTAMNAKSLHRNFMGYTTGSTKAMIGLGMSAISDSWYSFAQNEKKLKDYTQRVEEGEIPIFRGHLLTKEDLLIREHILNIMCRFETEFERGSIFFESIAKGLRPLQEDGLVEIEGRKIIVTEAGIPFVRNVCMVFDQKLLNKNSEQKLFSKTV